MMKRNSVKITFPFQCMCFRLIWFLDFETTQVVLKLSVKEDMNLSIIFSPECYMAHTIKHRGEVMESIGHGWIPFQRTSNGELSRVYSCKPDQAFQQTNKHFPLRPVILQVTIFSSPKMTISGEWIRPGIHICMMHIFFWLTQMRAADWLFSIKRGLDWNYIIYTVFKQELNFRFWRILSHMFLHHNTSNHIIFEVW